MDSIRIKLSFKSGLKSWKLVDKRKLLDISDLIGEITQLTGECSNNEKTITCLLIDGFQLPREESINILRENDTIFVDQQDHQQGCHDQLQSRPHKRKGDLLLHDVHERQGDLLLHNVHEKVQEQQKFEEVGRNSRTGRKKRRRKEQEENVDENIYPERDLVPQTSHEDGKELPMVWSGKAQPSDVQLEVAQPFEVQHEVKPIEIAQPVESQTDIDSEGDVACHTSKAERSMRLTPAEEALLALEPVKRRKKRGKKKKHTKEEVTEIVTMAPMAPPSWEVQAIGKKKVFGSEEEIDDVPEAFGDSAEATEVNSAPVCDHQPIGSRDSGEACYSSIDIKPLISRLQTDSIVTASVGDLAHDADSTNVSHMPLNTKARKADETSNSMIAASTPVHLSTTNKSISASDNFQQSPPPIVTIKKYTKGGTTVYKRVPKPKLRATMSPAILKELMKQEARRKEGATGDEITSPVMLTSPQPNTSKSRNDCSKPSKKITWHNNSLPCAENDTQTNASTLLVNRHSTRPTTGDTSKSQTNGTHSNKEQLELFKRQLHHLHGVLAGSSSAPDDLLAKAVELQQKIDLIQNSLEEGDREESDEYLTDQTVDVETVIKGWAELKKLPQVGSTIAYQLLVISETDYTPMLGRFQIADVTEVNTDKQSVTVRLIKATLNEPDRKDRRGRYDVTLEDGNELLTNITANDDQEMEYAFSALYNPKIKN